MVDVAFQPNNVVPAPAARKRSSLRAALKRKSTAAFLMTLPLILLIGILVIYPAFYSLHLATLNKSMQRCLMAHRETKSGQSGRNDASVWSAPSHEAGGGWTKLSQVPSPTLSKLRYASNAAFAMST
jgi:ABC-type sugar transport system permease subunit